MPPAEGGKESSDRYFFPSSAISVFRPSSHFPRTRRIRNRIPRMQSSPHIAAHTPGRPNRGASSIAAVRRTPHMLTRFMMLGASVSPAPRRAPAATMDAANSGSAKASIRRTWLPRAWMAGSGVSREDFHAAIRAGVRKINYFTYMDKAAGTAVAEWASRLKEGQPAFFVEASETAIAAMKENVMEAMKTFAILD